MPSFGPISSAPVAASPDITGAPPPDGSGPTPTVMSVTVLPAVVGIVVGSSQQFTASVAGANSPSQAVTWSINNGGTIGSTGLAPASLPIGTYTVTATSVQDGTTQGHATLLVLAPGAASPQPDIGLNTLIVLDGYGLNTLIG